MAQTFARNQVGVREDLADGIYMIDAKNTPLLSAIPKGQELVNSNFDCLVDAYAAPDMTPVPDGTDVSTTEDAAANRQRLKFKCMELRKTPKVTNRTEINNVAGQGKGKEFAKAITKSMVELKRGVECAIGSDNSSQDDNGTVGDQTRGLGETIKATAWTHNAATDLTFHPPAASIDTTAMASVTPATINAVMESQYSVTGSSQSYLLVVGATLKKTITNAVGYQPTVANQTAILRTNKGSEGAWSNNVQTFTGDFGTYDIVLSNWLGFNNSTKAVNAYRGYALDTSMLELRMHQPWSFDELPDMGGGRRGLLKCVFGLMVKNPKGLAKFAATS
jgi:hypothetical protein